MEAFFFSLKASGSGCLSMSQVDMVLMETGASHDVFTLWDMQMYFNVYVFVFLV